MASTFDVDNPDVIAQFLEAINANARRAHGLLDPETGAPESVKDGSIDAESPHEAQSSHTFGNLADTETTDESINVDPNLPPIRPFIIDSVPLNERVDLAAEAMQEFRAWQEIRAGTNATPPLAREWQGPETITIPLSGTRWAARSSNGPGPTLHGSNTSTDSSNGAPTITVGDEVSVAVESGEVSINSPSDGVLTATSSGEAENLRHEDDQIVVAQEVPQLSASVNAGRPRPRPKPLDLSVPRPIADPFLSPADSQPLYTSPSHPLEGNDDDVDRVPYFGGVEQELSDASGVGSSGPFTALITSLRGDADPFVMRQPADAGAARHGDSSFDSTFNRSNILNTSSPTRSGKLWSPTTAASQLSATNLGRVGRHDAYAKTSRGVDTKSVAGIIQSAHDDDAVDEDVAEATKPLTRRIRATTLRGPVQVINVKEEAKDSKHDNTEMIEFTSTRGHPNRTVVLRHLPPTSGLAFVQSLIHGGAVETMSVNNSGTSAHVTFTTAEACKAFWAEYPIGIIFKFRGKKLRIGVGPSMEGQVLDGKLEGYLAAGATRVVHVTGIDQDLSMNMLIKMGSGLNGTRKLEAIQDYFRDNLRTTTFRFASIADALAFKGDAKKESEWDSVDFQFAADPCEAAAGRHFN